MTGFRRVLLIFFFFPTIAHRIDVFAARFMMPTPERGRQCRRSFGMIVKRNCRNVAERCNKWNSLGCGQPETVKIVKPKRKICPMRCGDALDVFKQEIPDVSIFNASAEGMITDVAITVANVYVAIFLSNIFLLSTFITFIF